MPRKLTVPALKGNHDMAIDILKERLIRLTDVPKLKHLPPGRGSKRIHVSTVYRCPIAKRNARGTAMKLRPGGHRPSRAGHVEHRLGLSTSRRCDGGHTEAKLRRIIHLDMTNNDFSQCLQYQKDSRQPAWKAGALAIELRPRNGVIIRPPGGRSNRIVPANGFGVACAGEGV